jgi:hypothetical protein
MVVLVMPQLMVDEGVMVVEREQELEQVTLEVQATLPLMVGQVLEAF